MLQFSREDQTKILKIFQVTLSKESHILFNDPHLLWQQLYNRLQWECNEVKKIIFSERTIRSNPGSKPWAWVKTPYRESKERMLTITGENAKFLSCAISPNGTWIVTSSDDKKLQIWDISTGKELLTLVGHTYPVNACAISPDGTWFVSASNDKTLMIWDPSSGQKIKTLVGHTNSVNCCAISSDGLFIVSGSSDATLKFWNVKSGTEIRTFKGETLTSGGYRNVPFGCAISSDGKLIASACADKTIRIFSVENGQEVKMLTGHTNSVMACAFSPNNKRIISASWDKTLRIWDVTSEEELFVLKGHSDLIYSCVMSPAGNWILSASDDNNLKIWDSETGKCIKTLIGHSASIKGCSISSDGMWCLSASEDNTIRFWDMTGEEDNQNIIGHQGGILGSAFCPDGSWFVTSGWDENIKIWDPENFARARKTIKVLNTGSCTVSADSTKIISADHRRLTILDAKSGKVRSLIKGARNPFALNLDDRWVIASSYHSNLIKWDTQTGKEILNFGDDTKESSNCAINSDGTRMVSAGKDLILRVWDVNNGKKIIELKGHKGDITFCSFSPDGDNLLSASKDCTIKFWDIKSGELKSEMVHKRSITNCKLFPDTKKILYTDSDNVLRIWNIQKNENIVEVPEIGHNSITTHPYRPIAICADELGGLNLVEFMGLDISPTVVTAYKKGNEFFVKCPACQIEHLIQRNKLDTEFACPTLQCVITLFINSTFIQDSSSDQFQVNSEFPFSSPLRTKEDIQGFGTLIEIPSGPFMMGTDQSEVNDLIQKFKGYLPKIFNHELPQHMVELPSYWILKTPVTVKQFLSFVQESSYPWNAGKVIQKNKDHPIVYVNWMDVSRYCGWLTNKWRSSGMIDYNEVVRLPSEAEWEKAARGPFVVRQEASAKRLFPWGNELPSINHCNFGKNVMTTSIKARNFGDVIRSTTPVGEYSPNGDSPYGCVDMAGNVWEWTCSLWGEKLFEPEYVYPYNPKDGREVIDPKKALVIRGGAFHDDAIRIRVTYRDNCYLSHHDPYRSHSPWFSSLGFRIVVAREY